MKANVYFLECLTNLHVGSGETNFNIIDNEVERDVVTGFPTINSSGVKGALKDYFSQNHSDTNILEFFGLEKEEDVNGEKKRVTKPGYLKFLSANLIAQPIPDREGKHVYKLISPVDAINDFYQSLSVFLGVKNKQFKEEETVNILEKDITVIPSKDYRSMKLPVLARNQLNNGISKNLWYEEIVPHKSIFAFSVVSMIPDKDNLLDEFDRIIDGKIVQFGGNASIGYGLCKITKVDKDKV